jgi:predicted nucleic acid-binding protein
VTVFIDTSVWFAMVVRRDRNNARAKEILGGIDRAVTTDHVIVETWLLLNNRYRRSGADLFWEGFRANAAQIELVTMADLRVAWTIADAFRDQTFSIVDRTSLAVMERLGITRVASFDRDFAIYRYGPNRDRAFEVLR